MQRTTLVEYTHRSAWQHRPENDARIRSRASERTEVQMNSDQPGDDRFRALFEHSSDAHLIFDEGGITDCNPAAVRLLGASDRAEVLAVHPAALSPECQPDGRR